jgi:hypothetical protein
MTDTAVKIAIALGVAATCVTAVACILAIKREKRRNTGTKAHEPVRLAKTLKQDTPSVQEQPLAFSQQILAEAASRMDDFAGCFESLYKAARHGSPESCMMIMQEMTTRISHFGGCNNLKQWANSIMQRQPWSRETGQNAAQETLQLLRQAGLQMDQRTTVTADANTPTMYYHDELSTIYVGNVYKVKSPCWMFKGKTIEKGILLSTQ